MGYKYCTNCGKKITKNARFCPYCGTKQHISNDITNKDLYSSLSNKARLINKKMVPRIKKGFKNKVRHKANDIKPYLSKSGSKYSNLKKRVSHYWGRQSKNKKLILIGAAILMLFLIIGGIDSNSGSSSPSRSSKSSETTSSESGNSEVKTEENAISKNESNISVSGNTPSMTISGDHINLYFDSNTTTSSDSGLSRIWGDLYDNRSNSYDVGVKIFVDNELIAVGDSNYPSLSFH